MSKKYLTFANVFKDTFILFKKNIIKLILALLILVIPFGIIISVLFTISGASSVEDFVTNFYDYENATPVIAIYFTAFIIGLPLGLLYYIYCVRVLYNSFLGIKEKISSFLKLSVKKIFPIIGLYFLFMIIILASLIPTFVAISIDSSLVSGIVIILNYIFVIWLSIAFSYSFVIIAVEETTIIDSLKESWVLTLKRRGKIFIISLVAILAFYAVIIVIVLLASGSGTFFQSFTDASALANSISSSLVMTFVPLVITLLLYPLMFAFYLAIFINLKKEKGTLPADELVNEFMVEEKDDYNKW